MFKLKHILKLVTHLVKFFYVYLPYASSPTWQVHFEVGLFQDPIVHYTNNIGK